MEMTATTSILLVEQFCCTYDELSQSKGRGAINPDIYIIYVCIVGVFEGLVHMSYIVPYVGLEVPFGTLPQRSEFYDSFLYRTILPVHMYRTMYCTFFGHQTSHHTDSKLLVILSTVDVRVHGWDFPTYIEFGS